MEVGEPGSSRQSNPDQSESQNRNPLDRPYREGPTMATAALMNPSNSYHSLHHHRPSFPPPSFPSSAPTSTLSGMISPVESRRTSDGVDAPNRQSLPSISEVISGAKPPAYSAPLPSTMPPTPTLPSPFSSSAPSRPFSDASSDKLPSPRTLRPSSSFPPRPDTLPAFSDPLRQPALSRPAPLGRPPPPPNAYSGQQPSPPMKLEQLEAERRQEASAAHAGGGYSHQPPQPGLALYPQTGQLPPGQLPLSAGYPVSPRQGGPPLPSPYETSRPHGYGEEDHSGRDNKYEVTLNRAFEAWSYSEALSRIAGSSRTIFNFAEAFDAAARESQSPQSVPSRLPTESEIAIMLDNVYMVKKCLEDVREAVQQNRINNERARAGRKYDDEDMGMYVDGPKSAYGLPEVKKRRGRAAPPGRCHSCNRIDTPEWRRGPDGARTLCNACGLHYAKLERKRQHEQRSIRPKPSDER